MRVATATDIEYWYAECEQGKSSFRDLEFKVTHKIENSWKFFMDEVGWEDRLNRVFKYQSVPNR